MAYRQIVPLFFPSLLKAEVNRKTTKKFLVWCVFQSYVNFSKTKMFSEQFSIPSSLCQLPHLPNKSVKKEIRGKISIWVKNV